MQLPAQSLILAAGLGFTVAAAAPATATCRAETGAARNVLLELYTSEGCDSCPPADRRLSSYKNAGNNAGRLVPLAFHVDYWDRLGWPDRYASPQFTRRQYEMAALARSRSVYTPQFLRNGRDWRGGGSPLDAVTDTRPGARIAIELRFAAETRLAVSAEVAATVAGSEAWLAIYENNLESAVSAGENTGKRLRHDYVVRRLLGPLALDARGKLALRQEIPLEAGWKPADLGIAVFVQDKASGEILQAVQRPACPA